MNAGERVAKTDQELDREARELREAKAKAESWLQGYQHALTNAGDEAVEADRRRYSLANDVAALERELAELGKDRDHLLDRVHNLAGRAEAAERQLRPVTEERNRLQVEARVCREDAETNAARAEEAEQQLATVERHLRNAERNAQMAREQAAECRLEAAHQHATLSSLGTDPERLARQVGAGQAVELFGRVYVDRELASSTYIGSQPTLAEDDLTGRCRLVFPPERVRCVRTAVRGVGACSDHRQEVTALMDREDDEADKQEGELLGPGVYAGTELLEAQGGVFVPVPKGHMLSVTVTPYDDQPADDGDHDETCRHG